MWKLLLADGETRDDILFTSAGSTVRFDASTYGVRVEVKFGGKWYCSRLVGLLRGSETMQVAVEDGD